jgi:hypothetical protein
MKKEEVTPQVKEFAEFQLKNVGEAVDMSGDEFIAFVNAENITLGYLSGLSNLLKMSYNETTGLKNDLVTKVVNGEFNKEDEKKARKNIDELYKVLMRLENRIYVSDMRIKELSNKPLQTEEVKKG